MKHCGVCGEEANDAVVGLRGQGVAIIPLALTTDDKGWKRYEEFIEDMTQLGWHKITICRECAPYNE